MKKSAKRLLGVVFTLALMTILACGAFAAKPAVELTDVYFTVDAFDGVSPTVCFRNNSNKTIKYVTFTLVPLNAVGDRTSCTISGRSTVTAQVVGPIAPTRFDRTVANTVTSPASMGDFGPFQAQQQLATNYITLALKSATGIEFFWTRTVMPIMLIPTRRPQFCL